MANEPTPAPAQTNKPALPAAQTSPPRLTDADVWLRCYEAHMSALHSPSPLSAASGADQGLVEFRKRFPR